MLCHCAQWYTVAAKHCVFRLAAMAKSQTQTKMCRRIAASEAARSRAKWRPWSGKEGDARLADALRTFQQGGVIGTFFLTVGAMLSLKWQFDFTLTSFHRKRRALLFSRALQIFHIAGDVMFGFALRHKYLNI